MGKHERDPARRAAKRKYSEQRRRAGKRGIKWLFTFDTWLQWWGDDLQNRGSNAWQLTMQRIGDIGPYSPENTIKGRPKRNSLTWAHRIHRTTALLAAARLEQERDTCVAECRDDRDEDDEELDAMLGIANSRDKYIGV